MKANEFKKILKPLIKQTIKEVLLEEDILSKVVTEVARGFNHTLVEKQQISHSDITAMKDNKQEELYEKQRQERIKRLNESSGLGHQVFNNVTQIPETDSKSPLSGIKSNDAGVDISEIEKLSNGKWKTLTGGK
jgi:hypothetical protein